MFILYVTYFGLISDYNYSIGQNMYSKLFTLSSKLSFFIPLLLLLRTPGFHNGLCIYFKFHKCQVFFFFPIWYRHYCLVLAHNFFNLVKNVLQQNILKGLLKYYVHFILFMCLEKIYCFCILVFNDKNRNLSVIFY